MSKVGGKFETPDSRYSHSLHETRQGPERVRAHDYDRSRFNKGAIAFAGLLFGSAVVTLGVLGYEPMPPETNPYGVDQNILPQNNTTR